MKLPRDLSGRELVRLLKCYGYEVVRQEGSHIRLRSSLKGHPHHITLPDHSELKIGTLRAVVRLVAGYLEVEPAVVTRELFKP